MLDIKCLKQIRTLLSYYYWRRLNYIMRGTQWDIHFLAEISILKCFFLAMAEKCGSFHSLNAAENANRGEEQRQGTEGTV